MISKSNIKIVFFGTPEFAVSVLNALVRDKYNVIDVITEPDKPSGRGRILTPPPLKIAAKKFGLNVLQFPTLKTEDLKFKIPDFDIGIVAAYGKIIPSKIIAMPKYGILAIHPSLLPKYRGPSPVQTAILNGDTKTGVTIIKIDEELDHGPTLGITNYELRIKENVKEATESLFKLGAELLLEIIQGYIEGKLKPIPQDHTRATFTRKLTLADGEIKPEDTAEKAYNKIRALNPEPGTYFIMRDDKKLKIIRARISSTPEKLKATGLVEQNKELVLSFDDGFIILESVQIENKRIMSGKDFLNGYRHLLP